MVVGLGLFIKGIGDEFRASMTDVKFTEIPFVDCGPRINVVPGKGDSVKSFDFGWDKTTYYINYYSYVFFIFKIIFIF